MNEDRAARYHRLQRRTAWVSLATHGALILALVPAGLSLRLRDIAVAVTGGAISSPATIAIFTALLLMLFEAVSLPQRFYRSFVLERRYGVSSSTLKVWAGDYVKGLVLGVALAVVAAEFVYFSLARWPSWWWAISALAGIAAVVGLARLAPAVLLPIVYRFKPLDRAPLLARIDALSRRAGVPVLGVYEWHLGDKSRRANAALVGAGPNRRILLSDTLLEDYSDDEIEVILAHELGHHAHRDIRNGLVLEAALIALACAAAAAALGAWRVLGLQSPADVAGLPLLVMTGGTVSLLAMPLLNAWSRRNEHRADRFALQLTARPDAFVSAMRRLAERNLAEMRPSLTTVWFFHSHPTVEQRIEAARASGPR